MLIFFSIVYSQGVESDRVPSFSKAIEEGKPVTVEGKSTLADGLAVPRVGCNAFLTARNLIDKMVSCHRRVSPGTENKKNKTLTRDLSFSGGRHGGMDIDGHFETGRDGKVRRGRRRGHRPRGRLVGSAGRVRGKKVSSEKRLVARLRCSGHAAQRFRYTIIS